MSRRGRDGIGTLQRHMPLWYPLQRGRETPSFGRLRRDIRNPARPGTRESRTNGFAVQRIAIRQHGRAPGFRLGLEPVSTLARAIRRRFPFETIPSNCMLPAVDLSRSRQGTTKRYGERSPRS
jgi:hypothetical protein